MSEVGVALKEQEGIVAGAEGEEAPVVDALMQDAHAIVTQVRQSIGSWPEYHQALVARQRAKGKVGPYDRIVFEREGRVYVVATRGGEDSNKEDVSVRVARLHAIPNNLNPDDLRDIPDLPSSGWDNTLQVRSVRERKATESPSIRYGEKEDLQFNTPAAIEGAKRFAAEIASNSPAPVIDTTGRVI